MPEQRCANRECTLIEEGRLAMTNGSGIGPCHTDEMGACPRYVAAEPHQFVSGEDPAMTSICALCGLLDENDIHTEALNLRETT